MVAVSPTTRDIWVGAVSVDAPQSPFLAKKLFGGSTIGTATWIYPPCGGPADDKPFMTVGPPSHHTGTTETMYVAYLRLGLLRLHSKRSGDTPYVGENWLTAEQPMTSAAGLPQPGNGAFPILISRTAPPDHAGRLVVGFSPNERQPPAFSFSNNGVAGPWSNSAPFGTYATPAPGFLDAFPAGPAASVFPTQMRIRSFPVLALHPGDPAKVYLAFTSRDSESPTVDGDIFVAVSTNWGVSFDTVHRLTNTRLALPGDPSLTLELMPWITIDRGGGINLLFYRTVSPNLQAGQPTEVDIRYARFPNEAALSSGALPYVERLAGPFPHTNYWLGDLNNEYHAITSTEGCTLYAVYVRPDPDDPIPGRPKVYIRRIIASPMTCDRDLDADGAQPTSADVGLFSSAYLAAQPAADIDNNGSVDANDLARFFGP